MSILSLGIANTAVLPREGFLKLGLHGNWHYVDFILLAWNLYCFDPFNWRRGLFIFLAWIFFVLFYLLLSEHHKGLPLHPQFLSAPSSCLSLQWSLCSSVCFTNNKMLINILFILFCWTFTLITSYILGRFLFPWLQRKTTHKENRKQLACERCAWGGIWWFGGRGQTWIGDGLFSTCFYPFPELK